MNVQDFGWAYGHIGKFARLFPLLIPRLLSDELIGTDAVLYSVPLVPGQVAAPIGLISTEGSNGHFPYGHEVLPD